MNDPSSVILKNLRCDSYCRSSHQSHPQLFFEHPRQPCTCLGSYPASTNLTNHHGWPVPQELMAFSMLGLLFGSSLISIVAIFGPCLFATLQWYHKLHNSHLCLPPSPPGQLFFGHTRVIPSQNPEIYYQKLSKEYSEYLMDCYDKFWQESYMLQSPMSFTSSSTELQSLC